VLRGHSYSVRNVAFSSFKHHLVVLVVVVAVVVVVVQ